MNRNWLRSGVLLLAIGLHSTGRAAQASLAFVDLSASVHTMTGSSNALNAVACNGTNYVAVGTNSTVLNAILNVAGGVTNGLAWTKESLAGLAATHLTNLAAVTYGNGRYVIGGQNAEVWSSLNSGTSWPAETNFTTQFTPYEVGALAFNGGSGGTFVAAGETSQINSADANLASPWQTTTINSSVFVESYRGATPLGASGFAVCGVGGVVRTNSGSTWYVIGGNSWTSGKADLHGIAWDGNQTLVCVGGLGTNKFGAGTSVGATILVSTDGGAIWTNAFWTNPVTRATNNGSSGDLNAVAYTGEGFLAVGTNGTIIISPDGMTWNQYTNAGIPNTNLTGVTFATNGPFVGVAILTGAGGTVVVGGAVPPPPANPVGQTNFAGITNLALSVTQTADAYSPLSAVTVDWYDSASNRVAVATASFIPTNTTAGTWKYYALERDLRTSLIGASTEADFTVVTFTNAPTNPVSQTNFAGITNLTLSVTLNTSNSYGVDTNGDTMFVIWTNSSGVEVAANTATFTPGDTSPGLHRYYALEVVTNIGCSSCVATSTVPTEVDFMVVTFTNAPTNPVSQTNFAGITNLTLAVTLNASGNYDGDVITVNWYNSAVISPASQVAANTTTFTPGDTSPGLHRYYALEVVTNVSCSSCVATSTVPTEVDFMVVTFTNAPTNPVSQTNFAGITNLTLAVTLNASGNYDGDVITVNWYNSAVISPASQVAANTATFTPGDTSPGLHRYYAVEVATNVGCSSCVATSTVATEVDFMAVTFTNAPTNPVNEATCSGVPEGTALMVTLNAANNHDGDVITVNWYNSAVISSASQVAANTVTYLPTDTTVGLHRYYAVEVVTNIGCSSCVATSTVSTEVDFTVNPLPAAPTFLANETNCAEVAPNPMLMVTPPPTNGLNGTSVVVNWFGSNNGSGLTFAVPQGQGTNSITPTNTAPGTYYYYAQSEVLPTGCLSSNMTQVALEIQDCLSTMKIQASGTNVTVTWLGNVQLQFTNALTAVTNGWITVDSNGVAGATNTFTTNGTGNSDGFFRLFAP